MLLPPIPQFRRRRGGSARAALALVSVVVESADGADAHLRLVFNTTADNPLGDVSAAVATKWTARYDGVAYEGFALSNDTFNSLLLHLLGDSPEAGPDVLNYSNAPSDVSDALGRQLAAFGGFPL